MQPREPKFKIGTVYKSRGKFPNTCTIIDIYYTYNSKGEFVKFRYISEHEFCGQVITNHDVCETTVMMGLVSEGGN